MRAVKLYAASTNDYYNFMELVTVIVAQRLPYKLTYQVPKHITNVGVGVRVMVPLGKSSIVSAVVTEQLIGSQAEEHYNKITKGGVVLREIISVIDSNPIITPTQQNLFNWLSKYYIINSGELIRYLLPKELRIKGQVSSDGEHQLKSSRGVSKVRYIKIINSDGLKTSRTALAKYLIEHIAEDKIDYLTLRKQFTSAQIQLLIKKEIIANFYCEEYLSVNQELTYKGRVEVENLTTPNYQEEIDNLNSKPLLIHNKSKGYLLDNYIYLATQILAAQGQMLIVDCEGRFPLARFRAIFGSQCVPLNSNSTDKAHYKLYNRLLAGEPLIVIGNSKAFGLAFTALKQVIVVDEHATNFRGENSPFFNNRDVAIMAAHLYGSKVILESYAPSLESYHNTTIDKYNLLTIEPAAQWGGKVSLIEKFSIASKERKVYGNSPKVRYLSKLMITELERAQKSFIFHNRRGYNSYLICDKCSWVLRCTNCNVSMTYHQGKGQFVCHYCNSRVEQIHSCPECNSIEVKLQGVGSENIEQAIAKYVENRAIYRVDKDTFSTKAEQVKIISNIESADRFIVVGTVLSLSILENIQFDCVGVVDGDTLLNIDDFRAEEKAYRTLYQLREMLSAKGKMVIQTYNIKNQLLNEIQEDNYSSMYEREIYLRKQFNYPPFTRLTEVTIKDKNEERLSLEATKIYNILNRVEGIEVSTPITPTVDKIRGEYISLIHIRFKRGASVKQKQQVAEIISQVKDARIWVDI